MGTFGKRKPGFTACHYLKYSTSGDYVKSIYCLVWSKYRNIQIFQGDIYPIHIYVIV